jgi:hypothetical protein
MSIADGCQHSGENLLFAREQLASDIDLILRGDEYSAEALAQLFIALREAVAGGLEGIRRTRETLAAGVELTFAHSRAHAAALRLYLLAQEGQLKVEDEPGCLINAAIERSTARASKAARGARGGTAVGRARASAAQRRV